ncbi:high-affinity nicotinic acid transporter [Paracoccidioides lutzii Pb01]|uniref:High-affinity nicotinic acid transporter n=1 Tax=Paracoccidioides lutzii (strain ATCC MYA-826 / Pb01) TaxID=502779 RepID=C1H9Z1_PARBA|nr:high-affinity nicotinic acid transporter [Paracoccidioides lutzii Pb01]EEH37164.2 high-affinity nicotinic acid transporter [Paracoccidioides lutzii Pb01]
MNGSPKEIPSTPTITETHSVESIDRTAEKKLVWKCDLHVVPILAFLMSLAFLDRINIGNARLQGLERDLGMSGHDFNIALFIFFVPYMLCEVPSNIILKNVSPSTWLSSVMLGWGLVTTFQGVTNSFAGLLVCRVFLGIFEAGFVPGCVYLISMYYKRHELQTRLNFFISCSIMAGSLSGILAYAIAGMDGARGYSGWRWIFILEGVATVVAAVFSKFLIPEWPEKAKFLAEEERKLLLHRLATETETAKMNRLDKNAMKRAFTDVKIYMGFAFTMLGCIITTVGYIILLCQQSVSPGVCYFAVLTISAGAFMAHPITIAWLNNNVGGHYKRGISAAMQIGLGNSGGLIASNLFFPSEAPRYPTGFRTSLALVWVCAVTCIAFFLYLHRENRLRDEGFRDHLLLLPENEVDNLGDDHPSFRFTY